MSTTPSRRPSFKTLDEALSFIERQLDNGDAEELFNSCLEERASETMRPTIFAQLQAIHAERRLSSMYLDRTPPLAFPIDEEKFKLGGHAQELGYIHIDFRKTGRRWQLASIWMCR